MAECTRRLEFDAAHRVMRHESKCRNLHGHRYRVDVTARAALDSIGRVIDFGVIKSVFGGWLDREWDHGVILNTEDVDLVDFCRAQGWKTYTLPHNPTAEVMADYLAKVAASVLEPHGVDVVRLRVYETPNCWADWRHDS